MIHITSRVYGIRVVEYSVFSTRGREVLARRRLVQA